MRTRLHQWGLVGLLVLEALVAGCARHAPAPIEEKFSTRPPEPNVRTLKPAPAKNPIHGEVYRVQAGDTLYSIAWRLGLDFRQLATMNEIRDPSRIVVGQVLRVRAAHAQPAGSVIPKVAQSRASLPNRAAPVASTAAQSTAAHARSTAQISAGISATNLQWVWPAEGRVSRAVSATGSIGLEIRGTRGQTIHAAGGGQVVYGGSGLRGYGQLLIIKHDERFLSAYAHNDKLLVAEGQRIERGQPIALMGDSGASEVMLHFEIRKGGKAVEPLQYLPKR